MPGPSSDRVFFCADTDTRRLRRKARHYILAPEPRGNDVVIVVPTDDPGKRSLRVRGEAEIDLGSGDDLLVIDFADFREARAMGLRPSLGR